MRLVLASRSPRRKALLETIGIQPLVVPSKFDESCFDPKAMSSEDLAMALARGKAAAVAREYPEDVVVGADTIVVLGDSVLGKPESPKEAAKMLERLSGRTHQVYTGIALYEPGSRKMFSDVDCTLVTMRQMEPSEIEWYVGTGEPMGKAGGYGIQGKAALFVTAINGDYTGVIGLPLSRFYEILKKAGLLITSFFV
ncbi:MAG TPA: septum formation inhibitor Maf [Firmicutes bacterium]|nr:septum formation inhibitor Maf [Bacillota bacterium]